MKLLRVGHREEQVDFVAVAVELDARPCLVWPSALRQGIEGGADALVHLRRLAAKARLQVAAGRQGARLQPERGRVVALLDLNADAILPCRRVERSEELASSKANQGFQSLPSASDLFHLIGGTQEHHISHSSFDWLRGRFVWNALSHLST